MNGTMQYRPRLIWIGTPQKQWRFSIGTSFGSSSKDDEWVSKTINDSNIDIAKFPTSKVKQLAKKMESSKATTRPIKLVASDLQVAQVNMIRYQSTDLPASKYKKRKSFVKVRPSSHMNDTSDRQSNYKKSLMPRMYTRTSRDVKSVEIQITLMVSSVQKWNFNGHFVISMGTSQACFQKKQASFKTRIPKAYMLQASAVYACDKSICI